MHLNCVYINEKKSQKKMKKNKRCGPDKIESFRSRAVVVTAQSIEEAIEWLNEWNKVEEKDRKRRPQKKDEADSDDEQ